MPDEQKEIPMAEIEHQLRDTIPVEINLLELIQDFIASNLEQNDNHIEYEEGRLVRNLERYVHDWQFFGDDQQGLNSGSIGEAIAHLVGLGILDDFPEMHQYNAEDRLGVIVEKKPKSETEVVKFKVNLTFKENDDKTEWLFAGFNITTSKKILENRLTDLRTQRNNLQKEYSANIK